MMPRWLRTLVRLFAENKRPAWQSVREVGVTAVIAFSPILAGILISVAFLENQTLLGAIRLNTERGDLFILSTAIVAPVTLYVTVEKGHLPKPLTIHFPGGWFFIIIIVILFGTSAILFALKRLADNLLLSTNYDSALIYNISLWLYIIALVTALIVTFIKGRIESISAEAFRENDADFVRDWLDRGD